MANQIIENKWNKEKHLKEGGSMNKKESDFIHLHLHTHLSMMDGCMHHDVMFNRLKELGMNKVAITNNGNVMDMPKIVNQGAKEGIQVIPGCEVYMTWDKPCTEKTPENKKTYHLILLAMNNKGYENLMKITSLANTVGKYYKPRVDRTILEENSEGIICLSACLAGYLAQQMGFEKVLSSDPKMQNAVKWFQEVYGDRFYLEVQKHPGLPEQDIANKGVVELSKQFDIPLVATCDSHYAYKEHFDAWQSMMLLNTNFTFGEDAQNDYYLKSSEEMLELFKEKPEVVTNSKVIASRCSPIVFDRDIKYPPFNTEGMSPAAFLLAECLRGLDQRIAKGQIPSALRQKYIERMDFELDILREKNFSTYILIVADYTVWAKSQGILMAPGRGSGAGSLVCYLTYITEVDPIPYGLYTLEQVVALLK